MAAAPLPRSRPAAQGVQAAGIRGFVRAVEHRDIQLHSLLVLRHGHVVAEAWWAPYSAERVHLGYSLSKRFTSTAAGLAVTEGLLELDAPVLTCFPEHADVATGRRGDSHPAPALPAPQRPARVATVNAGPTLDG